MKRRIHRAVLGVLLLASSAASASQKDLEAGIATAAPLPASLPLRRDEAAPPSPPGGWPSLALLTLAGAGGAWTLWRRRQRGKVALARSAEDPHVVRVSSQALTAQASVHVVRWNGEELLVCCTAQQAQLLARRPMPNAFEEQRT